MTHLIALFPLQPGTTYFYDVVSGSTTDDNGGACYSFKTLSTGDAPPPPRIAVGHVMTGSGCTAPATSGTVTVTDSRSGASSVANALPINDASTGVQGTYALVFTPAAADTTTGTGYFAPQAGDTISVKADGGNGTGTGQLAWDGTSSLLTMPSICIGGSPPPPTVTIAASQGWNLIGGSPLTVAAEATTSWSWSATTGKWVSITGGNAGNAGSQPAGAGAWENLSAPNVSEQVTVQVCTKATPPSVSVMAHRWNMVGNICSVQVNLPVGTRALLWDTWDTGPAHYVVSTNIPAGRAAWVMPASSSLTLTPVS